MVSPAAAFSPLATSATTSPPTLLVGSVRDGLALDQPEKAKLGWA